MGIPAGLLVDRRGPKYGIAMGALGLGFGYFPLHSGTKTIHHHIYGRIRC